MDLREQVTACRGLAEYEIVFNGSVGLEKAGTRGLSHLAEHCQCEKVKEIEPQLQQLGLNWNAFTDNNEVAFILNGLDKNVKKMIPLFTQKVLGYEVEEAVFERERGIVLAEYEMYASDQEGQMSINLGRKTLDCYDPIGNRKDLQDVTFKKFMKFKDSWMKTPSFVMYTHGSGTKCISQEDLKKAGIEETNSIEPWNKQLKYKIRDKYVKEDNAKFDSQRVIWAKRPFISVGNFKGSMYARILKQMLTGGLTSLLMQEIREKISGVYSIHCSVERVNKNDFIFNTSMPVPTQKADEVEEKLREIYGKLPQLLTQDKYDLAIDALSAGIKTQEYLRFSGILDDSRLAFVKQITEKPEELKKEWETFCFWLAKELKADKTDYFRDDKI